MLPGSVPGTVPGHTGPPGEETVGSVLRATSVPLLSSCLESSLDDEIVETAWNIPAKPASPH